MNELTLIKDSSEKVMNILNDLVDEANKIHAIIRSSLLVNGKIEISIVYYNLLYFVYLIFDRY